MTIKSDKEIEQTLDARIMESRHSIVRAGNRVSCTECLNDFKVNDQNLHSWLMSTCISIPKDNKPTFINNDMMHVGNQNIHSTHKLNIHKGLVYCHKCGCRMGSHIKKLARECEPPTSYGRDSLQAIANDVLPPNLAEWPEDGGIVPSFPSSSSSSVS